VERWRRQVRKLQLKRVSMESPGYKLSDWDKYMAQNPDKAKRFQWTFPRKYPKKLETGSPVEAAAAIAEHQIASLLSIGRRLFPELLL